jgi:hypothetical protein
MILEILAPEISQLTTNVKRLDDLNAKSKSNNFRISQFVLYVKIMLMKRSILNRKSFAFKDALL